MAQLPEILTSAYTPEMDTLGVIPVIPVFEGARVSMSRNALTPGTRPLQLLPLPSSVNTRILRLKEPIFPDCKQFGRTKGHFGSSPKVCQYGA
ncbi:hypothetical protein JCGZ_24431 [Jatropha curcas]|uniref:Uncharacterized protein n=1 Tax=Jatropha curcas TaxID=180498 RepID=A0A067JLX4_JATCU|nr:hypothetical protein JCGZ_24431 [Jatropha curcas]